MKKGTFKIIPAVLVAVIIGIIYVLINQSPSSENANGNNVQTIEDSAEITSQSKEVATETEDLICVHVCGCVKIPGVYYLKETARVFEAVEAAGGFSSDAAENYLNMAELLKDGQQLYVPSKAELEEGSLSAGITADGIVNINTANQEELMTLPGIGEAKANAIISYREENGAFESPEDLLNVSGIGESIFEQLKDNIKV